VKLSAFSLPWRGSPAVAGAKDAYDEHHDESRRAQREADWWLTGGTLLMGTLVLGIVGLPIFLRGVWLQRRA